MTWNCSDNLARAVLLACVFLIGGCAEERSDAPLVQQTVWDIGTPPTALELTLLNDSDSLLSPTAIGVLPEHIVILDSGVDPTISILDRESGAILDAWGRGGQGPGEFMAPWSVQLDPTDPSTFWVYDLNQRRLTSYDISRSDRDHTDIVPLRAETTTVGPVWAGDRLVSLTFSERGRLAFFDAGGDFLRYAGAPPEGATSAPPVVQQQAFVGTVKAHPSGDRVVVGTRYASRIEVLDVQGKVLHHTLGPDPFEPVFQVTSSGTAMTSGEDMRFGYVDIAVTDERIYALYSGRTRAEARGSAFLGVEVHVYTWDGELISVLGLDDVQAIGLALDPLSEELYLLAEIPRPAVYRAALR